MLPFRISSKSAREYLTTLAKTEVMPRVMTQWDIIKHQVRSLNPFRGFEADEQIVKLERMTALYLPTWIVDASFEAKCRGNDGKAEANFITVSSRFPGHSWKPMDSLPLFPPPPYDMKPNQTNSGDPSLDPSANREAWETLAMVDYESYESYLKTKGNSKVQIQGGLPEPLPFTISPLFLPDMIRDQLESADATFIAELAYLHVTNGSRSGGIGSRLITDLESIARRAGDREIVVTATPSLNTVRFYRRHGYRPMATPLPELFELEPEDVHMSKPL